METKISALHTFQEYALIRRQQHPGWKGDPVLNGEAFARHVGNYGRPAYDMCEEADEAVEALSSETGLPPNAIRRFVSDCRKTACIQMYYEDLARSRGYTASPAAASSVR